jgi:hypothetical protein
MRISTSPALLSNAALVELYPLGTCRSRYSMSPTIEMNGNNKKTLFMISLFKLLERLELEIDKSR